MDVFPLCNIVSDVLEFDLVFYRLCKVFGSYRILRAYSDLIISVRNKTADTKKKERSFVA